MRLLHRQPFYIASPLFSYISCSGWGWGEGGGGGGGRGMKDSCVISIYSCTMIVATQSESNSGILDRSIFLCDATFRILPKFFSRSVDKNTSKISQK